MEIVPNNVSEKDLKDEVNRRSACAGYCSRTGEPLVRSKIMIMPPSKRYRDNYEKIFGHK